MSVHPGLPRVDADVVVVGGGPVGLAAAVEARRHGLDVVLVEPRSGPVDKACGEGLMPAALQHLHHLGVHDVAGMPFRGIRYVGPDGVAVAEHRFSAGEGRGVRRTELHRALAERADHVGVDVVPGHVAAVLQDGRRVQAVLRDGRRVRARWMLACDGLHSAVRRQLGLHAGTDGRRYGLRRHAATQPWTDHVEVHWSPVAEAYVTPVAPDEVGVAVLGPRGLDFGGALQGFPLLSQSLAGCEWRTTPRGAGPLRQRVRGRVQGRVLLAGDAAGYVDALTGEGLRIGLASASAAVRAVVAGSTDGYEQAWRRATRDYRWLTSTLVTATRASAVRRCVVPVSARAPRLFAAAVDTLAT